MVKEIDVSFRNGFSHSVLALSPLFHGCTAPDIGGNDLDSVDAMNVHGNNGLGGVEYEKIRRRVKSMSAIDYLIEEVNNNPKEITVIALGALTNIAAAIKENINDPNEIIKLPIHIEVKITIVCTDRQFFIHDLVLLE